MHVFAKNTVARPIHGYTAPVEDFAETMRANAGGRLDILREIADLIVEGDGGSTKACIRDAGESVYCRTGGGW